MLSIAIQILGIFVIIGIGVFATRQKWFSEDFSTQLSLLLIRVFYPCLLFSSILRKYTLTALADQWVSLDGVSVGLPNAPWFATLKRPPVVPSTSPAR